MRLFAIRLAILSLATAAVLATADSPGTTRIARWRADKACAFVLMFDDSCQSHVENVIPELTRRGMTGTFYINPGRKQYQLNRIFWEHEVAAKGFELANHTLTHRGGPTTADIEHELVACNEVIHAATPGMAWPRLVSYGQPGGIPKERWPISKEALAALLSREHLVSRPDYRGRGAMVGELKTGAAMIAYVDRAITERTMEGIVFHGVGGDWITTPMPVFIELLDGLEARKDKVWLTGHITAVQYATERDAASVTPGAIAADTITIALTCTADKTFFDQPLTLVTVLPANWTKVGVEQSTRQGEAAVRDGMAIYDVLPGGDPIILHRK
jgi:peptidoglycan/xylan/chitin deacetylase (PgdA/CDA1 family)